MEDKTEAFQLLQQLGASERLLQHAKLVAETADQLIPEFSALGVGLDAKLIQVGAVLHDAGKIVFPLELSEPGILHEHAGQTLLLTKGVEPEVARCCVTHASWTLPGTSMEERVIALADKLWKGKRDDQLELRLIDEVAGRLGVERWDIFEQLDSTFERIASDSSLRLEESRP